MKDASDTFGVKKSQIPFRPLRLNERDNKYIHCLIPNPENSAHTNRPSSNHNSIKRQHNYCQSPVISSSLKQY